MHDSNSNLEEKLDEIVDDLLSHLASLLEDGSSPEIRLQLLQTFREVIEGSATETDRRSVLEERFPLTSDALDLGEMNLTFRGMTYQDRWVILNWDMTKHP